MKYIAILFLCAACSSFNVPTKIPVMEKYDAVYYALHEVVDWAREHRGETQTLLDAGAAIDARDYVAALEDAKKLLIESAANGDAPTADIVAIVTLVEQTLAAEAIADGLKSLR